MTTFEFRYLVDLPLANEFLKFGYESNERLSTNRTYALSLLRAQTQLISLQSKYETSFASSTARTILHYRDYIISILIDELLVNMQFSSESTITKQSERVWSSYAYDDIWEYLPLNATIPESRFAGLLGTPAYYLSKVDVNSLYPNEAFLQTCSYFWDLLGTGITSSPRDRISELLAALDVDTFSIELITEAFVETSDSRREFITAFDYTSLLERILIGEYQSVQFNLITPLVPDLVLDKVTAFANSCLGLVKPSGFLLCLQFLIVENLTRISILLTELPETDLSRPMEELFSRPQLQATRLQIVDLLSTIYDCLSLQSLFDTIKRAAERKEEFKSLVATFMSSSNLLVLDTDGNYRLPFSSTEVIDLTVQQQGGQNYQSLLGAIGKNPSLFITSNVFIGIRVTLTTNAAANIVQIDLATSDTADSSLISKEGNSSTFTAANSGYAAFYASTENTGIVNYETYKNDLSSSNVVVVSFTLPVL